MFRDNCPLCQTPGKVWHKEPEAFKCPNCFSIYSRFGLIMEAQKQAADMWT